MLELPAVLARVAEDFAGSRAVALAGVGHRLSLASAALAVKDQVANALLIGLGAILPVFDIARPSPLFFELVLLSQQAIDRCRIASLSYLLVDLEITTVEVTKAALRHGKLIDMSPASIDRL